MMGLVQMELREGYILPWSIGLVVLFSLGVGFFITDATTMSFGVLVPAGGLTGNFIFTGVSQGWRKKAKMFPLTRGQLELVRYISHGVIWLVTMLPGAALALGTHWRGVIISYCTCVRCPCLTCDCSLLTLISELLSLWTVLFMLFGAFCYMLNKIRRLNVFLVNSIALGLATGIMLLMMRLLTYTIWLGAVVALVVFGISCGVSVALAKKGVV